MVFQIQRSRAKDKCTNTDIKTYFLVIQNYINDLCFFFLLRFFFFYLNIYF